MDETHAPFAHQPVLRAEVMSYLAPKPGDTVLDLTVGAGGHARLFLDAIGPEGRLVGFDVDPIALDLTRQALNEYASSVSLVQANFSEARDKLGELGVAGVDVMLADLGVSSMQLDREERGFSFRGDGPLDMRMDPRLETTAADLINRLKERELADLIFYNSQEMASRKIARRICEVRREGRITTTEQLSRLVAKTLGVHNPNSRRSKIHPATRTFQALRMAVNDEMGNLATLLETAPAILKPGGRFAVIAFHSVEDKAVKLDFRRRKAEGIYEVLTKKPVVACEKERKSNPRSRSAKLRAAARKPVEAGIGAE